MEERDMLDRPLRSDKKIAKVKEVKFRRPLLRIAAKQREYFSDNLAMMLRTGVPVGEALESLASTSRNKQYRKAVAGMQADIEAGSNLSVALDHSGIVSDQTLALVRLGEETGNLVENLQMAAKQEEKRRMMLAKVRSALIYPTFVVGLTVIVGVAVAWFLLPRLAVTFAQMQVSLPPISKLMLSLGEFLRQHGVIAVPMATFLVLLAGYVLFAAPRTKSLGQRLLFVLPGSGRLIREVEVTQFGSLLGELLDAGLTITKALQLLASATAAPHYQKFYSFLAGSLDNGMSFKESMAQYPHSAKLIPPEVQQMVMAGERSGSLPEVLKTIGRTYEQKADITTRNLEAIIEPALLVMVAVGVLIVAVSVLMPIYSLVGGLGG